MIFVAAIALDSATFLLIGPRHEANPIVLAMGPVLALGVRWAAVAILVAYRSRPLLIAGAVAGIIGAASNLRALTWVM